MQKLVDSLKERYIVLINDFLPFLAETLDDPDSEVIIYFNLGWISV